MFESHLRVMVWLVLVLHFLISLCFSFSSVKWRWYWSYPPYRAVLIIKQVNMYEVLRIKSNQTLTKYKQYVKLLRTYHMPGSEHGVCLRLYGLSSHGTYSLARRQIFIKQSHGSMELCFYSKSYQAEVMVLWEHIIGDLT